MVFAPVCALEDEALLRSLLRVLLLEAAAVVVAVVAAVYGEVPSCTPLASSSTSNSLQLLLCTYLSKSSGCDASRKRIVITTCFAWNVRGMHANAGTSVPSSYSTHKPRANVSNRIEGNAVNKIMSY